MFRPLFTLHCENDQLCTKFLRNDSDYGCAIESTFKPIQYHILFLKKLNPKLMFEGQNLNHNDFPLLFKTENFPLLLHIQLTIRYHIKCTVVNIHTKLWNLILEHKKHTHTFPNIPNTEDTSITHRYYLW